MLGNRRKKLSTFFLGASINIVAASAAHGQADRPEPKIEEVIVTATRVPQSRQQLGTTVSVLTSAAIERQQIDTLDDALERVPGVAITRSGGLGQNTQVRMRGFTTKHVLTMIDGIKINNPSEGDNQFGLEHIFLNGVERIEVLRGPQSGLYGADAVAGVINVITKRGEGETKLRGAALYGSHDTYELAAGADGASGQLGYLFGASRYETDGISLSSRPPGNVEPDAYDNNTVNARLDLAASDNVDLTAWARYVDATNDIDSNFLLPNNPGALPAFLFQDSPGSVDSGQLFSALRGTWRTLGGKFTHDAQFSFVDIDTHTESPGTVQDALGRTSELQYYGTYFVTPESFLIAGSDYKREKAVFEQPVGPIFAGVNETIWNWGLFASANIALTDGVYLSGALRHDDNELFGGETTFRVTGAFNLPDAADIAGVDTKLRASYGTGAEAPGLRQLLGLSPTFRGNPNLQPESSRMVDFGIEQQLENGRARWSLTYYDGRANDGIFNIFNPTLRVSSPQNVDSPVDMDGLEFDMAAAPADWLEIELAYTYARSVLRSTKTQLFGRPRHEFSTAVTVKPLTELSVTVDAYKRGKFFSDFPSTFVMPGYELFNLTAAYELTPNISMIAKVQNVFDKFYEEKLGDATYDRTAQLRIRVVY